MAVEKIEITQTFYINKNWSESTDLSAETIVVNGVAVEASTLQWGVNAFADVASAQAATGYTAGGTLLVFAGSGNNTSFTSDAVIATADGISAVISENTTAGAVNLVVMEGSNFYAGGSSPVGYWSGTDGKTTLDVAGYFEVGQLNIQAGSTVNVTTGGKVKSTGAGDVTIIGGHLVAVGDGTWDKELVELASTNLSPDMGGATDEQRKDFDSSISVKDAAMIVNGSILYGRTDVGGWFANDALYENNEYTVTLDNAKLTMNAIANGNAKDNKQENYMINPALILGASETIYYDKLGYISYGGTRSATDTSIVIGYKNHQNIVGDAVLTVKNGSEVYTDAIIGGATAKIDISGGSKVFIKDFYMAGAESVTVNEVEYSLAGGTAQIAWDSNLTITNSIELEEGTTVTVDFTGFASPAGSKFLSIVDYSDATATNANFTVTNLEDSKWAAHQGGGYLFAYDSAAVKADFSDLLVDASLAGSDLGAEIVVGGKTYIFGLTAYADYDEAYAAATETATITLNGNVSSANQFVSGKDITFAGEGVLDVNSSMYTSGGNKYVIGEGVTIGVSESGAWLYGGTIDIYGELNTNSFGDTFMQMNESQTINVYEGGLFKIAYISSGMGGTINVIGDGEAFGETQLHVATTSGGNGAMLGGTRGNGTWNITDFGVAEVSNVLNVGQGGSNKTGKIVLDQGKLTVGNTLTLGYEGTHVGIVEMSNGSVLEAKSIVVKNNSTEEVSAASSFTQDYTSMVITESITVAEGATYKIDFAGFDPSQFSGFSTILAADTISGNIVLENEPTTLPNNVVLVNDAGKVYLYDSNIVDVNSIAVNADWSNYKFGDAIVSNGETLYYGVTAFSDAFDAIAVAKELSGAVTIDLQSDFITTNKAINFVSSSDKAGEDGWYETDANITFTGTGTIQGKYFLRGDGTSSSPKGSGETITIGAGTTISTHVGEGQINVDGNTINVYGTLKTQFFRISEHGGGEVNVYDGGYIATNYLSTSNSNEAATSPVFNVYGNGEAFDKAQFDFVNVANAAIATTANSIVFNVKDYGTVRVDRDDETLTFVGKQQFNLDSGRLVMNNRAAAKNTTLSFTAESQFNLTGDSVVNVDVLNVNDTAKVSLGVDSTLRVANALTIAEGASFAIDLTGIGGEGTDWSKVNVVLSAGAVTGDITVTGAPTGQTYSYVDKTLGETGRIIYYYDQAQLDTSTVCVTSGTYADGDIVVSGSDGYIYGTTAFGTLQDALDLAENNSDLVTVVVNEAITSKGCHVTGGNVLLTGSGTISSTWFGRGDSAGGADPHSLDSTITIDEGMTVKVTGEGQIGAIGTNLEIYGTLANDPSANNYVYLNLRDVSAEDSDYEGKDKVYTTNIYEGGLLATGGIRSRLDKTSYVINADGGTFRMNSTSAPDDRRAFTGVQVNAINGGTVEMVHSNYTFAGGASKDENGNSLATAKLAADNGTIKAANTTYTFNEGSTLEITNGSTMTVKGLVLNSTGNIIDASSTLTYSGSINVADGADLTVDFTGFEAAEDQNIHIVVDGSNASGSVTGDITFTGLEEDGWMAVNAGGSIYAFDASNIDLTNLVVNSDWSDASIGEIVTVDGVDYFFGMNAFADFDSAIGIAQDGTDTTITNVGEEFTLEGKIDASALSSLTMGGDWYIEPDTKIYGDIIIADGGQFWGTTNSYYQEDTTITIIGDAVWRNYYLNAEEPLEVTIVLNGNSDGETARIQCGGRYYDSTNVTITADNVKNLTEDTYKIATYNKYNTANYYNYTVDSALTKAGYVLTSNKDGLFLTKGTVYDYSTLVYDNAWKDLAAGTEVTYDGKTYVIGYTAYGNINDMASTAVANRQYVPDEVTLVINSNYDGGTATTSLAYSIGIKVVCGVDMKDTGVVLTSAKVGNSPFDFYCFAEDGQKSHITVGEGVTFEMTGKDQPNLRMQGCIFDIYGSLAYAGTGYSNFYGSFWSTEVTVHETGLLNAKGSYYAFNKLTAIGNGESYDRSQIMVGSLGNSAAAVTTIKEYGTYEFLSGDSGLQIGKTGTGSLYLDNGRVIGAGTTFKGTLQIGSANKGTLVMTGDSLIKVNTVTIKSNGSADVSFTSTIDYGTQLTIEATEDGSSNFSVNFSDFSVDAMGGEKMAIIVDGRDASKGISGNVNYIGLAKLKSMDWAVGSDGKNVYIFDQSFFGKDVYVSSAWSDVANLTAVEEGSQYVIGLNAYGSLNAAVAAGATGVISKDVLSGDINVGSIALGFDVEADVVIDNGGNVVVDALNADGKAVEVDQLTVVGGGETISRAEHILLGDADGADAVLTLDAGEKLFVNQMSVVEGASIVGSGLRFSGQGAALNITDGMTLTMSVAQMLEIQGVAINAADGAIILSDIETLTVSQKAELLEEYGAIIKDLADATVTEDAPVKTDVADLSELLNSGFEGEVYGTTGANKLIVGKGEEADYSGIDYNMRGGKNVVTIDADAEFAIGDLENVSTVDVKAGKEGTVASFGEITTSTGNSAVKVGNNVTFTAAGIGQSTLGGTNAVSFGNDVEAVITGTDESYGYIYHVKSVAVGKGSSLIVKGGDIRSDELVTNASLKVGNDSTLSLEDPEYDEIGSLDRISTVSFGNNVNATVKNISGAKSITLGKGNTLTATGDITGVYGNSIIKAGDDSVVSIGDDVNLKGGMNAITTGKSSDWTIGGDVMNVNTLTVTAAGNWMWNAAKTAYTLQNTTMHIAGDFLAGEGATTLNFGNYSIVKIDGSILESDLGSTFKIIVGSNADVKIAEGIQSVNNLTIGNGVDYKTFSVIDGKSVADVEKAIGTTTFAAEGKITGTAGNDTIKIGNKADVTLGRVSMGAGNDTINIGKESYLEASDVNMGEGKNTVIIGADSWMNVDDLSGVNKLTVTGALDAKDVSGTDLADAFTFNGAAEVNSINMGDDAGDKLIIGKGAEVAITGGISGIDVLNIGAEATVSATESTIVALQSLGNAKGSKIDDTATFIALDDAAGDITSTTIYEASTDAWLGIGDDTADVFALGDGVNADLTDWSISGEGINVEVYTTTDGTNWKASSVEATDGVFTLGDYTLDGGTITGIKVAVSLDEDNTDVTKYSITLA